MKEETIKLVENKLNSLQKQPARSNPRSQSCPPGFPKVGPFARPRPMDISQAALQISAAFQNIYRIDPDITEYQWNNQILNVKQAVKLNADRCWLYCNDEETNDIVKSICEIEGIQFPPKFKAEDGE